MPRGKTGLSHSSELQPPSWAQSLLEARLRKRSPVREVPGAFHPQRVRAAVVDSEHNGWTGVANHRHAVCATPPPVQPARSPYHMPLEMLEKLDDLRALDAAVVDLKIEPPEGQAAKDRKTLPVEGFLEHGRLPAGSPGAHSRGPCAERLPCRSASSSCPCPEKIENTSAPATNRLKSEISNLRLK